MEENTLSKVPFMLFKFFFTDNKVSKKSNTLALVIFIMVFLILAACLPVFVLLVQNLNKSKNKNVKNPSDFMHLVENGTVYNPKLSHRNVKMKELIGGLRTNNA